MDFKWNRDKWEYRTIDKMAGEFMLTNNNGIRQPLQQLDVWEGSDTLGVFFGHGWQ